MRPFCRACNRTTASCFCSRTLEFKTEAEFALIVHPYEARSTVGTAWILRKSIAQLHWFRSEGSDLDTDPRFLDLLARVDVAPFLLFPSPGALNLDLCSPAEWSAALAAGKKPLFFVVDGAWGQARAMMRRSSLLRALPRVSFQPSAPSEYGFKKQPHPACLSCVEGVHRVIEKLASRGWGTLPPAREHDRMLEIFRDMVKVQLSYEQVDRRRQRSLV